MNFERIFEATFLRVALTSSRCEKQTTQSAIYDRLHPFYHLISKTQTRGFSIVISELLQAYIYHLPIFKVPKGINKGQLITISVFVRLQYKIQIVVVLKDTIGISGHSIRLIRSICLSRLYLQHFIREKTKLQTHKLTKNPTERQISQIRSLFPIVDPFLCTQKNQGLFVFNKHGKRVFLKFLGKTENKNDIRYGSVSQLEGFNSCNSWFK